MATDFDDLFQAVDFSFNPEPELTSLEPFPDIFNLFSHYSSLYFSNELGACSVEWSSSRMTSCAGVCHFRSGGGCVIRLSEPILKFRPSRDLKDTLLHEMIHALFFLRNERDDDRSGHGTKFKSKMLEINQSCKPDYHRPPGGYRITVYHSMHNEVNLYRRHVWKCNRCGNQVRRAMNRPPQEADCFRRSGPNCYDSNCHWHRHLRTCGGAFEKISGPDPKSKKERKTPRIGEKSNKSVANLGNNLGTQDSVRTSNNAGTSSSANTKKSNTPLIPFSGSAFRMLDPPTTSSPSIRMGGIQNWIQKPPIKKIKEGERAERDERAGTREEGSRERGRQIAVNHVVDVIDLDNDEEENFIESDFVQDLNFISNDKNTNVRYDNLISKRSRTDNDVVEATTFPWDSEDDLDIWNFFTSRNVDKDKDTDVMLVTSRNGAPDALATKMCQTPWPSDRHRISHADHDSYSVGRGTQSRSNGPSFDRSNTASATDTPPLKHSHLNRTAVIGSTLVNMDDVLVETNNGVNGDGNMNKHIRKVDSFTEIVSFIETNASKRQKTVLDVVPSTSSHPASAPPPVPFPSPFPPPSSSSSTTRLMRPSSTVHPTPMMFSFPSPVGNPVVSSRAFDPPKNPPKRTGLVPRNSEVVPVSGIGSIREERRGEAREVEPRRSSVRGGGNGEIVWNSYGVGARSRTIVLTSRTVQKQRGSTCDFDTSDNAIDMSTAVHGGVVNEGYRRGSNHQSSNSSSISNEIHNNVDNRQDLSCSSNDQSIYERSEIVLSSIVLQNNHSLASVTPASDHIIENEERRRRCREAALQRFQGNGGNIGN